MSVLQRLGFTCAELDDPYAAIAELSHRPMVYRALVLSLASIYREELALIATVKRRLRHVDVWMTQADGRLNALAEAMRFGADGLLTEDGLHRTASTDEAADTRPADSIHSKSSSPFSPVPIAGGDSAELDHDFDPPPGEPVLTADELRALLQEHPANVSNPGGESS